MNRKSLIVSIKSFKLSSQEKLFFQKPWGIILFKRNIKNKTIKATNHGYT